MNANNTTPAPSSFPTILLPLPLEPHQRAIGGSRYTFRDDVTGLDVVYAVHIPSIDAAENDEDFFPREIIAIEAGVRDEQVFADYRESYDVEAETRLGAIVEIISQPDYLDGFPREGYYALSDDREDAIVCYHDDVEGAYESARADARFHEPTLLAPLSLGRGIE